MDCVGNGTKEISNALALFVNAEDGEAEEEEEEDDGMDGGVVDMECEGMDLETASKEVALSGMHSEPEEQGNITLSHNYYAP